MISKSAAFGRRFCCLRGAERQARAGGTVHSSRKIGDWPVVDERIVLKAQIESSMLKINGYQPTSREISYAYEHRMLKASSLSMNGAPKHGFKLVCLTAP